MVIDDYKNTRSKKYWEDLSQYRETVIDVLLIYFVFFYHFFHCLFQFTDDLCSFFLGLFGLGLYDTMTKTV